MTLEIVTLTDEQLLDQMRETDREILAEENHLRLLNDQLNMRAMEVRADTTALLYEPKIWLEIWRDEEWREFYNCINKTYARLVDLKADANNLHHRFQYATMSHAANITASIARAAGDDNAE